MVNIRSSKGIATESNHGSLALSCTDLPLHQWVITRNGLEVRLNVNQIDIEPAVLVRDEKMFIGAEQGIFVLDTITGLVTSETSGISNVQWIEEDARDYVVFAAEDEVIVLDNLGNLLWRENLPDVIRTTNTDNENVLVTVMSGEEYELNLKDGRERKNSKGNLAPL